MKKNLIWIGISAGILLVVILVLIFLPRHKNPVRDARYEKGRQIAEKIFQAEKKYYESEGKLTAFWSDLNLDIPAEVIYYYIPGFALSIRELSDEELEKILNDHLGVGYDLEKDLLGIEYELENGDTILINQSNFFFVSYFPKGMNVAYRIESVQNFSDAFRICGVTSRRFDPAAYEEQAAACRAMGAKEIEDPVYGSTFVWEN